MNRREDEKWARSENIVIALLVVLELSCHLSRVVVFTYRISGRFNHMSLAGTGRLLAGSILPLLVGVGVMALLRSGKTGPWVGIGVGLAAAVLAELPLFAPQNDCRGKMESDAFGERRRPCRLCCCRSAGSAIIRRCRCCFMLFLLVY